MVVLIATIHAIAHTQLDLSLVQSAVLSTCRTMQTQTVVNTDRLRVVASVQQHQQDKVLQARRQSGLKACDAARAKPTHGLPACLACPTRRHLVSTSCQPPISLTVSLQICPMSLSYIPSTLLSNKCRGCCPYHGAYPHRAVRLSAAGW